MQNPQRCRPLVEDPSLVAINVQVEVSFLNIVYYTGVPTLVWHASYFWDDELQKIYPSKRPSHLDLQRTTKVLHSCLVSSVSGITVCTCTLLMQTGSSKVSLGGWDFSSADLGVQTLPFNVLFQRKTRHLFSEQWKCQIISLILYQMTPLLLFTRIAMPNIIKLLCKNEKKSVSLVKWDQGFGWCMFEETGPLECNKKPVQIREEWHTPHPTPTLRTILVGKQFRGASESPLKVAVHFFFLDLLKTSRVIKKNRRSVHLQKTTPSFPAAT